MIYELGVFPLEAFRDKEFIALLPATRGIKEISDLLLYYN